MSHVQIVSHVWAPSSCLGTEAGTMHERKETIRFAAHADRVLERVQTVTCMAGGPSNILSRSLSEISSSDPATRGLRLCTASQWRWASSQCKILGCDGMHAMHGPYRRGYLDLQVPSRAVDEVEQYISHRVSPWACLSLRQARRPPYSRCRYHVECADYCM
jgi:hypothetical protein